MSVKIENLSGVVLQAAIACAREDGYQWITRKTVAQRAGVSLGSVSNAYVTMRDLKRAVLQYAVDNSLVDIVAQGLADRHPIAGAAPPELKSEAARLIMTV
jgi:AcrR family transcriptional regulator